jgi:hypothetical protein
MNFVLRVWDDLSTGTRYFWVFSLSVAMICLLILSTVVLYAVLKWHPEAAYSGRKRRRDKGHTDGTSDKPLPWWSAAIARLAYFFSMLPRWQKLRLFAAFVIPFVLLGVAVLASLWDVTILRDLGITSKRLPGGATVIGSEGRDKAGRLATYEILILSREYYWRYGSSTVVINTNGDPVAMEEKLRGEGIQARAAKMTDLITIGTASCVGGIEEEAGRALERANTMMAWLRDSKISAKAEHLYILNLGKYTAGCERVGRERFQRAVVIVGVTGKQPGVNIQESFRDALYRARQKAFSHIEIENFSNWSADQFALVDVT